MTNILQSALQQAMGAMDKYVRDPIVNGGVSLVRKVQDARDQAYQNYWKDRLHEMLSPLAPPPTPDPFEARGWIKTGENSYTRGNNVALAQAGNPQDVNNFRFQMGLNSYPNARAQLIKMYQAVGNPPLSKNIDDLVKYGERYGVDPRVMAMVGQIESSGGIHYPTNTYNPFGYLGGSGATVNERLNAGFNSLPHAIEALTKRFSSHYPTFTKDPSISNLQQVYNANPAERQRYLDLASQLIPNLQ